METQLTRQRAPIVHGNGRTGAFHEAEGSFAVVIEQGDNTLASTGRVMSLVPNRAALVQMAHMAGFEQVEFAVAREGHNAQYVDGDRAAIFASSARRAQTSSQPPAAAAPSTWTFESAAPRFASSSALSWSTKCARTPRTWVGAAAREPAQSLRGQHRVRAPPVGGALPALHEAGAHQTVDPAGDPARRQPQPAGEIRHAQRVLGGLREVDQHLVLAERQAVLGPQLAVERRRAPPW